jgi:hypothetical protein
MHLVNSARRKLAAATLAGLALGAGGAGVVAMATGGAGTVAGLPAATLTATSGTAPAHAGAHAHHGRRALLGRTDHATIEVRRHGHWVTIELDRGLVQKASSSAVTLLRPDGTTVTLAVTPTTKAVGVVAPADLAVGKRATVVSVGGAALRVVQHVRAADHAASRAPAA